MSALPFPPRHLIPLPELLRPGDRRKMEAALVATARSSHEVTTCLRKRGYESEQRAAVAAQRASRRCGEEIVPYWCRYCANFHVGHVRREATDADGR